MDGMTIDPIDIVMRQPARSGEAPPPFDDAGKNRKKE
jgi:hypothetical protein